MESTKIGRLSAKVSNNRCSIERTLMISFKMWSLYVVLDLPDSVETQLGCSGKFNSPICSVFLSVSTGTKSIKIH